MSRRPAVEAGHMVFCRAFRPTMPSYIIEVQKTPSRSARLSSVGRGRLTMQAIPVPLKRPARFAKGTERRYGAGGEEWQLCRCM